MESGSTEASAEPAPSVATSWRTRWLIVGALSIAVLATSAPPILRYVRFFRAHHDVAVLALALDGYTREQHQYPQGSLAEICALLRGESLGGQNPRRLDYVEASAHEMNAAGEFVDPWGTPYRMKAEPTARVYSCGPNRADEQGAGDDIASWK